MKMKRIVFPKRQDSKLDEARNGSGNIQFRFPKVKMPVRQESGIHASRQNRMEGALPYEKLSGIPYHYIKYALAAVLLIFVILDMVNDPVSSAKIDTVAENVVKAAEFQGME